MKKNYFIVEPVGEPFKGFPTIWKAHKETLEELFRSMGYPYTDNTAVKIRKATADEVSRYE